MSVHTISLKGARDANEDKHDVLLNLSGSNKQMGQVNYYGVYDGHGGKYVSSFLSKNLPRCFTDPRVSYPLDKSYVKNIYDFWQNTLKTSHKQQSFNTGSTCCVAIHFKKSGSEYLNVLNTGDSRCVLCKNDIAIPLTIDHKPHWPREKARIKHMGGEPYFDGSDWRINDLSVSRAFGDLSAAPYVVHDPEIFKYKLTNDDKFMVLACDGLWDVLDSQTVVNYVLDCCYDVKTGTRINKHINIAKRLADLAIAKDSGDNVTVIVVFFD